MSDDELVIDRDMEEREEYEVSRDSEEETEREDISIKLLFGTEWFNEDQSCDYCDEKAQGVLVVGDPDGMSDKMEDTHVVCGSHREFEERAADIEFEGVEWHSFEKEVE